MTDALYKLAPNNCYSSVKIISDNIVRKDPVKYRTPQKLHNASKPQMKQYKPSVSKYAERNVRGLALIITDEEKKEAESFKIDDARLAFNRKPKEQDDAKEIENSEAEEQDDDNMNLRKEESDDIEVEEKKEVP